MQNFVQLHTKYKCDIRQALTFPPHLHSHVEMIYIWQGETEIRVDGSDYRLTAGDMLLIFPNCVHSFRDCCSGRYFCAIFPCEAVPAYSETLKTTRPKNPFISGRVIGDDVRTLLGLLSRKGEEKAGVFSGVMGAVLSEVLPHTEITEHAASGAVKQLLDHCLAHYREPLTLRGLSAALHISPSRISHIFEEKVGLSFRYYVNYLRVLEASRLLLSTEDSISDIALSCGFDSIRSFNRNFLFMIGMTPTAYRRGADFATSNIF